MIGDSWAGDSLGYPGQRKLAQHAADFRKVGKAVKMRFAGDRRQQGV